MEYLLEGLAAEAQRQGQQTRYKAYLTALRSMQKYPLPLKSGQEAMMLEGVGPNIAFKLDQLLPRLQKEIEKNKRTATTTKTTSRTAGHKRTREDDDAPAGPDENASESAHNAGQRSAASASKEPTERSNEPAPNKRPRSRAYTPRLRSIPYAVVMALSRGPTGDPMSRATLLTTAAAFCDSPAVTGDKEDGAWKTAISTLVKKGFVQRHPLRSTPHYSLTTEGEELAERLSRSTTTITTTGKGDSAPAPRSVVRAATAVSSVATAKASASAGQLHGHDSNEDSCDIDADDDDDTGYRRSAVKSKKKAAPSEKERQRRAPSEEEDKENRENGTGGVTQGGWESSGKQTSSLSSSTKPRVTIDLCASPSPSASPSYYTHHDYNFDYSPLGTCHRLSPYRSLAPASPNRLLHPFLYTQHPSSTASTTMGHADASSPAAPATAPYKPSFRFGYVNEDEQWCTYRWEAAEKFHEGERYYRISTTQDPTLWDSHYRLLVSPFRKSATTNLHRAWLREDDAPVCARAPIAAEGAATGTVAEAAAAAESGSDRENATRLPTGKRNRGGLARRNLTTELDDVVADCKTTMRAATAQAAPRKPKRGKKNVTEKESESEKERKRRAARVQVEATTTTTTARQRQRRRALPRDAYEVVMLVDTREIAGKGNAKGGKSRKTIFQEMVKRGIACEERSLALGDFMWVARDKRRGAEYVMDVIVERKKVDDLWASIKDGRYYEQKFRLARSGVERVVYIVEGALQAGGNPHKTWNQLPVDTLESALVSTQVGNDFVVQRCATLRESISFLKSLTRQLTARTEPITLRDDDEDADDADEDEKDDDGAKTRALWEIGRWSEKVSKSGNLTITDVFAKQLLQINGVSPAKAKAITDRYATPRKLAEAYGRCADKAAREALLAQLTAGGRKLGPVLSKRVHDAMWTTSHPKDH